MKTRPPFPFMLFSIAFVLVGVLTTLRLPCPLSHGTGILPAAQGLKVESAESKLVSMKDTYKFTACGTPIPTVKYTYLVNMVLTNEGTEPSQGSISVSFNPGFSVGYHVLIGEGEGEDVMVVEGNAPPTLADAYVNIPAGATRNIGREFTFIDQAYGVPPGAHGDPHQVTVEAGREIADPMCGPAGKLPFVKWLEVMALKMMLK